MPRYDFHCERCMTTFEIALPLDRSAEIPFCDRCGTSEKVTRVWSRPSIRTGNRQSPERSEEPQQTLAQDKTIGFNIEGGAHHIEILNSKLQGLDIGIRERNSRGNLIKGNVFKNVGVAHDTDAPQSKRKRRSYEK